MNYNLLLALTVVLSDMFLTAWLDINFKKTNLYKFFQKCRKELKMRDHYKSFKYEAPKQRNHPYMIHSVYEGYLTYKKFNNQ